MRRCCLLRSTVLVMLAVLCTAANAAAASIAITNHSFETQTTPDGTFIDTGPPTGWSVFGTIGGRRTVGVLNPGTDLYPGPVPDGNNVAFIFLDAAASAEAGIQQTLGATLQLATQYTLTVEVGNIATGNTSFNFTGFPGYRIDLLAGDSVIASDNNTLLPGEGLFLTSTVQVTIGASHLNAGQALSIHLVNLDGPAGIEVNFDNVRLDAVAAVPEPSSLALISLAMLLALPALYRRIAKPRATGV